MDGVNKKEKMIEMITLITLVTVFMMLTVYFYKKYIQIKEDENFYKLQDHRLQNRRR